MAEIRQFAHSGREIDDAVEALENSSAGLEIIDGELTLANIPDVSLGTITDTDLQEWLTKGLPIKLDNALYIPSSITSTVVQYEHVGYAKASEPSTHYLITYQYLQYIKATHTLSLERSETISTEQLTAGVGIDIVNGAIEVEIPLITPNVALTDDEKAHIEKKLPIRKKNETNLYYFLSSDGFTVDYVHVSYYGTEYRVTIWRYRRSSNKFDSSVSEWNIIANPSGAATQTLNKLQVGSVIYNVGGTTKYRHHVVVTVEENSTSSEALTGLLYLDIINSDNTPFTALPTTETPCYGEYYVTRIDYNTYFISAVNIKQTATNTALVNGYVTEIEDSTGTPVGTAITAVSDTVTYTFISDSVVEI